MMLVPLTAESGVDDSLLVPGEPRQSSFLMGLQPPPILSSEFKWSTRGGQRILKSWDQRAAASD